jgi:hypothetical protein
MNSIWERVTTIRIEAEDLTNDGNFATLSGGDIKVVSVVEEPANNVNASGEAYVDYANATGTTIGPNVDRLEVTTPGTGPFGDVAADAYATLLTFSAETTTINGAPREVGGGIADLSWDEGSNIEVNFIFVDNDSDNQPVTVDGPTTTQALSFIIESTQVGDTITIEAESFTDLDADNLIVTGNAAASNEQLIRLTSNAPANVGTELSAGGVEPGWYIASLYVFDETDGEGALTLTIGDTVLEARNISSDNLSADVILNDDFGTLVGSGSRGNAGQSGNRKEIVFETPFEVTAGDLASLELRGAGGERMRIDSLVFERIDEPVNSAPTLDGLAADASVDENSVAVASLVLDGSMMPMVTA